MKLATAIKNANEVARRVRTLGGVMATPMCGSEAVRISRIWVFGSTIKGQQNPNDLDLMIEIKEVGRRFNTKQTTVDKRYLRAYGIKQAPSALYRALKNLTKGMQKVHRCLLHEHQDSESRFWDNLEPKVLLYPRNDFAELMKRQC